MLPHLLNQIPRDQHIGSVTADGANDTRRCHNAIADRGAAAQKCSAMEANDRRSRRQERRAARIEVSGSSTLAELERRPPPEPRRDETSRDIATQCPAGQWMQCVKLMGQRLMARDFDRHVAEVQVRIAVLNGYTALGIPVTKAMV